MPSLPQFSPDSRRVALWAVLAVTSLMGGILSGTPAGPRQTASRPLVAIFVVDGLRPDSISAEITPTLERLRRQGVEYRQSHSVFPTVKRLNTATLVTGTYPSRHGIVGNSMLVAAVNERAPFDTGDHRNLLALESGQGRAITAETLGEILHQHGRRLVTVSSGSTGNGYLLNPTARRDIGVAINGLFERGVTAAYPSAVSDDVLRRFGAPPADPDDLGQMQWTDRVLREYVIPELAPDVWIDWLGPLDSAQHGSGVGSPAAREALVAIDRSIAATLATLEQQQLRPNVIVTSDHGFAHHGESVDVIGTIVAAGLKASRTSTDIMLASQSQSLLFYVDGHNPDRIRRLVRFLQTMPWVDVVFTPGQDAVAGDVAGTFSFNLIHAAHPSRAADVIATLRWSDAPNAFGARGTHAVTGTTTGPLAGGGSGHGGLAPWVVRNTFIAAGPAFKSAVTLDTPMSLADITPTVLEMLGIPTRSTSAPGHGRVLRELLRDGPSPVTTTRIVQTRAGDYAAELTLSAIDGHQYVDGGRRLPTQPSGR